MLIISILNEQILTVCCAAEWSLDWCRSASDLAPKNSLDRHTSSSSSEMLTAQVAEAERRVT